MPVKREPAVIPREMIEKVIEAATPKLILVGGQALGVWLDRYGLAMPGGFKYVSRDVGFLSPATHAAEHVRRLAKALGGRCELTAKRQAAFTALVGQAVREMADGAIYNVDVLREVFGADRKLSARAVDVVRADGVRFRVMHPLDLLKSRLDNLYALRAKQNDLGRAQLVAGIHVVRAFMLESADEEREHYGRPDTLRYVAFIEKLAASDAGKKVARRERIHVADAVEPSAVPSAEFHTKHLPRLAKLMSAERQKDLSL
jgi:hypothetical protein